MCIVYIASINKKMRCVWLFQGSADSNYSQPSSDLSLDEEKESLRREKERQALSQLDKARVSISYYIVKIYINISTLFYRVNQ